MEFDVVEELKRYRGNKEWINSQIVRLRELEELEYNLKSPSLDGMPKAYNKPNYSLEILIDESKEIRNQIIDKQNRLNQLINKLEKIEPYIRMILYDKYIHGLNRYQIAKKYNYSEKTIERMLQRGLEELKNKQGKN